MIACIANNGDNGEPIVGLWECPCLECTKLEWEAAGIQTHSLAHDRAYYWPEHYSPLRKEQ